MRPCITYDSLSRADIRTGRPCLHWNDQKWQEFFFLLKLHIPQADPAVRLMPLPDIALRPGENYQGCTNYQYYCKYINGILSAIRSGQADYCYYIYQIADLCRFEPDLKTRFCGGRTLSPYIKVWLEPRKD